jgi:molybdopterin molybdotransferase
MTTAHEHASGRFPPPMPIPDWLLGFAEARAVILDRIAPLAPREMPLAEAFGCVLAADVTAAEDIPPFANSAMDGFALRSADLAGAGPDSPVALRLAGEVFAGAGELPTVGAGTCVRITTGAPLPPGADAVVPVEYTRTASGDGPGQVGDEILFMLAVGGRGYVREAGEDVIAGAVVLRAGHVLEPAAVGMLASVGRAVVSVHPRPRVAIVSTGDELVDPGAPLGPGQIRNSNSFMLLGQVRAAGAEAFMLGRLRDDPAALRAGFAHAASEGDAVVTSGGVSVGEHDFTKQVLSELGDVTPRKVAMQPGMPQAFGFAAGVPLFGLPGNPVSAFVVFELLVRPALRKLAGYPADRLDRPRITARLAEAVRSPVGRVSFLRVRLASGPAGVQAALTGAQGSGMLTSCVVADGLAVVPEDLGGLPAGAEVEVVVLREDATWEPA